MARGRMYEIKNHFVASLGEFVGTFLFLFLAFAGTQTANQPTDATAVSGPNLQQLLYISLVFGFSLAINVWIFFRVSGGLFNPAVTLALCICGVVPVLRSCFVFVAQLLAGIAAAAVVKGIIPGDNVFFSVQLRTGTSIAQGLFLEMFLTAELVFTILMLAAEKTKATFVAPIGIGLALFVAELVGVYWTGGALNPARAFGPAVVQRQFAGYHWIYWLGPVLGALLASGFYGVIKYLNYEEVNGDQDRSEDEEKILAMAKQQDQGRQPNTMGNRHGAGESQRSDRPSSKQRNENISYNPRYNSRGSYSNNDRAYTTKNNENFRVHTLPYREPNTSQQQQQQQHPYQDKSQDVPPQNTTNRSSSIHMHRNSKAFAPEPPQIQYDNSPNPHPRQRQRSPSPPPPPAIGPDGQQYVQDSDAQIRGARRKGTNSNGSWSAAGAGLPADLDIHRQGSDRRARDRAKRRD